MEPITQKLIHSFGALADLGQEVASSGDFNEMVRTSLHLLLGTLAIRRGIVVAYSGEDKTEPLAVWGLEEDYHPNLTISESDRKGFLSSKRPVTLVKASTPDGPEDSEFIRRYSDELSGQQLVLLAPMIVHDSLAGLVMLGGKASGEPFTGADLEVVHAMVR
ncbi:MAG: hypothetical protein LC775_01815, partial [Acidobacteria bacterium]|nr:hypothetical protein [Acidobacteriota bacterium]